MHVPKHETGSALVAQAGNKRSRALNDLQNWHWGQNGRLRYVRLYQAEPWWSTYYSEGLMPIAHKQQQFAMVQQLQSSSDHCMVIYHSLLRQSPNQDPRLYAGLIVRMGIEWNWLRVVPNNRLCSRRYGHSVCSRVTGHHQATAASYCDRTILSFSSKYAYSRIHSKDISVSPLQLYLKLTRLHQVTTAGACNLGCINQFSCLRTKHHLPQFTYTLANKLIKLP